MRTIGASDAFLYTNNTGKGNTMEIQIDITLERPVDPDALQQAADAALELFPEFSAQLVIQNGRLMYMEDEAPVRIHMTDAPAEMTVNYCTEDTNGHVWYLFVDKNDTRRVTFSCLHGMSDFAGCMALIRTLLYRYRQLLLPDSEVSPETLAAAGIRTSVPEDWDRTEALDPYGFCAAGVVPAAPAASGEAPFVIRDVELYPPTSDVNHIWHVTLDTGAFHARCKALGTSFAPLMIDALIGAVDDCYEAGSETIVAGLPVDMRPIFGIHTVTNFSDAVLLPLTAAQRALPIEERCGVLKRSINEQRTPERMGGTVLGKAQAAKAMADDPAGFTELTSRLLAPILAGAPRRVPLTFMITYPGRTDLPECLAGTVTDILPISVMGKVRFFALVSTHGPRMTMQIVQRFEGDKLPNALAERLRGLGLEAEVRDMGLRRQGYLLPEKLTSVE